MQITLSNQNIKIQRSASVYAVMAKNSYIFGAITEY